MAVLRVETQLQHRAEGLATGVQEAAAAEARRAGAALKILINESRVQEALASTGASGRTDLLAPPSYTPEGYIISCTPSLKKYSGLTLTASVA